MIKSEIETLVSAILKIEKVAFIKLEKNQEEDVRGIVLELKNYFIKLISLQKNKPAKFNNLITRKDKRYRDVIRDKEQFINRDLEGIELFPNVFFRIWKKSIKHEQLNISYFIIDQIVAIITELYELKIRNQIFVDYFIRILFEINRESKILPPEKVYIQNKASYSWYFEVVNQDEFELSKLDSLQLSLFNSIKYNINANNYDVFISFVSYTINALLNPLQSRSLSIPQNYLFNHKDSEQYLQIVTEFQKCTYNSTKVFTLNKYQSVVNEIRDIKEKLSNLDKDNEIDNEFDINEYINNTKKAFKYNNLKQLVIWLGSYCLFKERYNYIEGLMFYNSPKDSRVIWVNEDINPIVPNEILLMYHNRNEINKDITFYWDHHHDFSTYFKRYILILICNSINHNLRNGISIDNTIQNIGFYNNSKNIQEIEYYNNSINKLLNEINRLDIEDNYITKCGFNKSIIKNTIIVLKSVIDKIDIKAKEIEKDYTVDKNKEKAFKEAFIKHYNKRSIFRQLLKKYGTVSENIETYKKEDTHPYGIIEASMKSVFANEDKGTYIGWPESYADIISSSINHDIIREYITACKKIKQFNIIDKNTFLIKINEIIDDPKIDKSDLLILFTNIFPAIEIFESDTDFRYKETMQSNIINIDQYQGQFKGIDTFVHYDGMPFKSVLILDKNKLGVLTNHEPIVDIGSKMTENIYIDIIDLNKDNECRKKIISEKSEWLTSNYSTNNDQEEYLKTQVNIKVLERFSLKLPDDFNCWYFSIK